MPSATPDNWFYILRKTIICPSISLFPLSFIFSLCLLFIPVLVPAVHKRHVVPVSFQTPIYVSHSYLSERSMRELTLEPFLYIVHCIVPNDDHNPYSCMCSEHYSYKSLICIILISRGLLSPISFVLVM